MELAGQAFIATRASSGIGLATAVGLSGRGAKAALIARSGAALQALAKRLDVSLAVTADMTDVASVRSVIEKVHQHIDG